RGAPWGLALCGAVELLGHKFAVPAQNRIGFDNVGDFLQRLLAELLADLCQSLALAVTQSYTSLELIAENTIFSHAVLITQQQFLIDGPRDIPTVQTSTRLTLLVN